MNDTKLPYEYEICNDCDEEIFRKQCLALEKHIPGLEKGRFLTDVDGTLIQLYFLDGKKIRVTNDCTIGSVSVESEIELKRFFEPDIYEQITERNKRIAALITQQTGFEQIINSKRYSYEPMFSPKKIVIDKTSTA